MFDQLPSFLVSVGFKPKFYTGVDDAILSPAPLAPRDEQETEVNRDTGVWRRTSLFSPFAKLREAGYWIAWTPHAELIHHESASRGFDDSAPKQIRFLAEVDYMKSKWGHILHHDPFYNPNLSLGENLFTLAFPPRTTKPWQSNTG